MSCCSKVQFDTQCCGRKCTSGRAEAGAGSGCLKQCGKDKTADCVQLLEQLLRERAVLPTNELPEDAGEAEENLKADKLMHFE